ncbi:Asp23/Gls24 family envelope stress response protein [Streptomyces candidus]|uniref:Putative alkaline shock family protein YloU n=1 Tax=Streptomyces candidus TaxID=67283 RepID=A0A7X0HK75_9ACTN|nr:Asp23/Gls24 family envelope stress response protein [Streptomyces candidus]MBB6439187.1 putative alkaline shock family protein YloU [Streptomyces candidus]GHH55216.1 hypothetical protein GCM10018773_59310 [Streptomyces candidus]
MTAVVEARPPASVPAADRGALQIADRVVTKIAARAASEALGDTPPAGVAAPHAEVAVRDSRARVRIGLELGFPSDIAAQCALVRRQVSLKVRELAGMEVPEVTVVVDRLLRVDPHGRRTR